MDPELITRLNTLWKPVYPHLARWIEPWIPENTGHILEMGPFSGGIIASLLERHSTLRGLIALEEADVARTIRKSFGHFCPILLSPLAHLPLLPTFNMVVCRGAFFFLNPEIIKESSRLLAPGGHALLGGGYGPGTPSGIIAPISEESKDLNYRLGKKRLSRSNLEKMASEAGLETQSTIIDKGGLWLLISSKP
ncbi:MAG: class I SAM-dependent methyltransferase [Deltaproteobacteria bacterium]|nr:class I SAM-dependent methyltransferase [Deltaproteobacteria bacterium]